MRSLTFAATIVCAVLFCGAVHADTVTLTYTLDYASYGNYFVPPGEIIDHWPHYRGAWEDWGWTHDLVTVPSNATGIVSATLSLATWDVDAWTGEIDVIYVNGVRLGDLDATQAYSWGSSTFALPSSVLDDLWEDGEIYVYMDVDSNNTGERVAIGSSTLSVTYNIGDPIPEPATVGLLGLGALLALRRRRLRTH